MILNGDCLEVLKTIDSNSVDSLVTDPPAGISFMGKEWDHHKGGRDEWIKWMAEVMGECHRVLKPGAHGLVWAIPRTSHWTATALEDAGFEVRDVVTHLFGSGFPKSLDISKAIDKAAGAERENDYKSTTVRETANTSSHRGTHTCDNCGKFYGSAAANCHCPKSKPVTQLAKQWQGWGTALKPASEHWILVRKPLGEKTVAANVLKHGTGGINIDASRIATDLMPKETLNNPIRHGRYNSNNSHLERDSIYTPSANGRFPANLVLEDDSFLGEYSRFFYCAKISTSERNAGLEDMPDVEAGIGDDRPSGQSMSRLDGRAPRVVKNHHPTVKPKKLMSYFIRMITPPGGVVLDPFMGSGSTGIAAKECGFEFIGIEKEKEYFEIACKRIEQAKESLNETATA